ncbi:AhpC-TSA-domain-containing protein [Eremomyces bilateralis CBS 781.70]|uniref:thioredoxin-dependent peroxiredoxin n=1 Tax=Eremomyces bilateralis CBS 781.70 TaxID=1392243 RepID=A0A6G1G960_9PEZI|nr:AhpC-TSA-domain-containing protein [Eremomyces bilateralis CBS 781.70]KAF1814399.1 AhpC-TSA-domain-containing protein [Eremomyces bilateralis CBS 781.70]
MVVELRKRKAPAAPAPDPPAKKKSGPRVSSKVAKVKEVVQEKLSTKPAGAKANGTSTSASAPKVGDVIDLATFGGKVTTHEGKVVTLKSLVEDSGSGVVIFTYPRASTPGCTNQVCLFRDSYTPLTATGLKIYGLSGDSTKANTTFATKQKLPYPLLCDPGFDLIKSLGLMKSPKGTKRGVFAVDKAGKVLVLEEGGPAKTVDIVKALVEELSDDAAVPSTEVDVDKSALEQTEPAETAAEVAESAEKVDG